MIMNGFIAKLLCQRFNNWNQVSCCFALLLRFFLYNRFRFYFLCLNLNYRSRIYICFRSCLNSLGLVKEVSLFTANSFCMKVFYKRFKN